MKKESFDQDRQHAIKQPTLIRLLEFDHALITDTRVVCCASRISSLMISLVVLFLNNLPLIDHSKHKGCAFVDFETPESASPATKRVGGVTVGERTSIRHSSVSAFAERHLSHVLGAEV